MYACYENPGAMIGGSHDMQCFLKEMLNSKFLTNRTERSGEETNML